MKVVVQKLVHKKLRELLKALLDEGYFSVRENAEQYVSKIYDAIITLPNLSAKETKDKPSGHFYASYKANRHTTWYILFDKEDNRFIIRNLIVIIQQITPSLLLT